MTIWMKDTNVLDRSPFDAGKAMSFVAARSAQRRTKTLGV